MGFCMEPVGRFSVETRRESFRIAYEPTYEVGGEPYVAIEVAYEDLPDMLEAISLMVRQRDIPHEVVSRIRWMPGSAGQVG